MYILKYIQMYILSTSLANNTHIECIDQISGEPLLTQLNKNMHTYLSITILLWIFNRLHCVLSRFFKSLPGSKNVSSLSLRTAIKNKRAIAFEIFIAYYLAPNPLHTHIHTYVKYIRKQSCRLCGYSHPCKCSHRCWNRLRHSPAVTISIRNYGS